MNMYETIVYTLGLYCGFRYGAKDFTMCVVVTVLMVCVVLSVVW